MSHIGSKSKEKLSKIWIKGYIFFLKPRFTNIWSNRGHTVSISQKLVIVPKMPQSQDFKTTFKIFLAFVSLSVRVDLLCTLSHRGPCTLKSLIEEHARLDFSDFLSTLLAIFPPARLLFYLVK